MASITYNPKPGDPDKISWGGKDFEAGKAVDVKDNPTMLRKAQGNPSFEVSGVSKDEQEKAEVVGNYRSPDDGREITLVRTSTPAPYLGGAPAAGGPAPPTAATQGSVATIADRTNTIEPVFGAKSATELGSGKYEGAAQYKGPQGTEGAAAKPAAPVGASKRK